MSFLRNPAALFALNLTTLMGVVGSTYNLRSHMVELSEDHEARMVCYKFISFRLIIIPIVFERLVESLENTHHPVLRIVYCSQKNGSNSPGSIH